MAIGTRLDADLPSLNPCIAREENEAELRKNVKRVMEVIVGLLNDRVDVEKEPKNKKARVQEYLKKNNHCYSVTVY